MNKQLTVPTAQPFAYSFNPAHTALVVIDMQRDFVEPGGFGASLGNDVTRLQAIIPAVRAMLDAWRAVGGTVLHTREAHAPDLSDCPPAKRLRGKPSMRIGDAGPMGRILIAGEPGAEIVPELAPLPGQLVVIWRVQPDGTVWIGRYDFAEAVLSQELQQLDEADPAYAEGLFVPHAFGPLPGQSYQARKIGCAQYTISPDNAFVRLWYLDASTTDLDGGNLRRGLAELIKETLRLDWYGTYPGRVVTQRPDGTLDIALDSRTIPPLSAVRYRVFCPGARLSVAAGSRVEVRFDNADPMKPVADLFDPGEAQLGVARLNDPSRAGGLFATWINQVQAAINSLAPGAVTPLPPNTDLVNISGVSERVFIP
jgi:hypothetical protein